MLTFKTNLNSFVIVAIELIVQHIRDFLNNRTRPDSDSTGNGFGGNSSPFLFDATKGKRNIDTNSDSYYHSHSTHYRPH